MNKTSSKTKKLWKRIVAFTLLIPILFFSAILIYVYSQQDAIVQSQVESLNLTMNGKIQVADTHLEPFQNFPYVSIKIDHVQIFESKAENSAIILEVEDIYVGFKIQDLLRGNFDMQSLLIEEGFFNLVIHPDGSTNIQNAMALNESSEEEEEEGDAMDIHLKKIKLKNLDIHQLDETSNLDIETFIYWAKGGFNTKGEQIAAHIDTEFEMNIIDDGDTTYIKHKHFEFHTDLVFNEQTGLLTFEPSGLTMEHGDFDLSGTVDTKDDMNLNLEVKGTKPNFNMLIAFAPHDVVPVLERYQNAGKIFFNAEIKGQSLHGQMPYIEAVFGASEAYLENVERQKKIENMGFEGHFTNGKERKVETMEFSLTNMTAKLEEGNFIGSIFVQNFTAPEIDMQLDADFDLDFLANFLNLTSIENPQGKVAMHLKFHDIINLDDPEQALEELNQAYYSEIQIDDLSFTSSDLPAPLNDLDAHLIMKGDEAKLDKFNLVMGKSDLS
ncbi:MAG: AsmA family protein, partial [Schleiferiaceae bacterium]|nr:AsmA family protein [Schleiferiaceae bacterium]